MKKTINIKFPVGDMVCLKTGDPVERIVTGIMLRDQGKIYELSYGEVITWHQEIEIEKYPESVVVGGFASKGKK